MAMLNPGFDDDKSAMFSILSASRTPKPLCENYIIKWTRQGMARDIDQLNNFKVGKMQSIRQSISARTLLELS